MKITLLSSVLVLLLSPLQAAELHVATGGDDTYAGTQAAPLRTIQRAAHLAQPGDVVTVHAGVYRERINPPRGGESNEKRIVYQAAAGEKVEITGSERVKNWERVQDGVWKVTVPNTMFGSFHPYRDLIRGDWFTDKGRLHHSGAVYLNGEWLAEAAKLAEVLAPAEGTPLWFGQVDEVNTTLWAQFKGVNPNEQEVEINVRQSVFYPEKPGMNYITVRGFTLRNAATPWAPPTSEQIGLIGTHWSKGWIIENNVVSHSVCSGISLGKHGDKWDNTSADTAEGYVKTIERAQAFVIPWTKEHIGHHIVRHNTISHCEQAAIVGSMGAAFSTITGNTIHDIHVRRLFSGAEMAGIKFHGAIDVEISGNHIYRTWQGVWLDWMAQGTRVTRNLFHDNALDLFVEVNHGPFLVDNNIFLSPITLRTYSQGGAYVHNLIAGSMKMQPFDERLTPVQKAHSTELGGLHDNPNGDDRYYHNIFVERMDLSAYDAAKLPVWMEGNVFLKGAKPSKHETAPMVKSDFDPTLKLEKKSDGYFLEVNMDPAALIAPTRKLVTTSLLGQARASGCAYENPDGSPLQIDSDYFGKKRHASKLAPGPFDQLEAGLQSIKVW